MLYQAPSLYEVTPHPTWGQRRARVPTLDILSAHLVRGGPGHLRVVAVRGRELERLHLQDMARSHVYNRVACLLLSRVTCHVSDVVTCVRSTFLLLKSVTSSYQSVTARPQSLNGSRMLCL